MENNFTLTLPEVQDKILVSCPTILQFKNSLRFIQSSTSLSMDNLILKLDVVGQECFLAGLQEGLQIAKKELLNNNAGNIQPSPSNCGFVSKPITSHYIHPLQGKKEEKS